MTTIIWDAKTRILATDSREIWDGHKIAKTKKLFQLDRKNCYVATAGDSENAARLVLFLNKNVHNEDAIFKISSDEKFKGVSAILIYNSIPFTLLSGAIPMHIASTTFGLGTGAPYALAALEKGDSPIEAVKFASKFDCNTDDEVQYIQIPETKQARTRAKRTP